MRIYLWSLFYLIFLDTMNFFPLWILNEWSSRIKIYRDKLYGVLFELLMAPHTQSEELLECEESTHGMDYENSSPAFINTYDFIFLTSRLFLLNGDSCNLFKLMSKTRVKFINLWGLLGKVGRDFLGNVKHFVKRKQRKIKTFEKFMIKKVRILRFN